MLRLPCLANAYLKRHRVFDQSGGIEVQPAAGLKVRPKRKEAAALLRGGLCRDPERRNRCVDQ